MKGKSVWGAHIVFVTVVLSAVSAFAWRKENIIPANDVVTLTNTLYRMKAAGETYDYVSFEPGTYDLSPLVDAPMSTPYIGKTLLSCPNGTIFRSTTGNPDDVILDAKGVNARILVVQSGCEVWNLTFKGGNACGLTGTQSYNVGGAIGTTGGTVCLVKNCKFIGNKSGGGGAVDSLECTDCYFEANSVPNGWGDGGAGRNGKYVNCTFVSNTNSVDWCGGGAVGGASLVSGCTAISNIASIGGAFASCKGVTNCVVKYNYATRKGGAFYKCGVVRGCPEIVGNAAGSGGGVFSDTDADDCVVSNNYSSVCIIQDQKANMVFRNCRFVNCGELHRADLYNCHVHEVTNKLILSGNMHYTGVTTQSVNYAFMNCSNIVNTLITGVRFPTWVGNLAMFYCDLDRSLRVENCTISDCIYPYLVRGYGKDVRKIEFVNDALVRNFDPDKKNYDVSGYESPCLRFVNCVYGAVRDWKPNEGYGFTDCTALGKDKYARVRFTDEGEHPYTPKPSSPLVKNKGVRLDWMDDALDLAGNPRLKDGQVDIGAYQCWLDPLGVILLLR